MNINQVLSSGSMKILEDNINEGLSRFNNIIIKTISSAESTHNDKIFSKHIDDYLYICIVDNKEITSNDIQNYLTTNTTYVFDNFTKTNDDKYFIHGKIKIDDEKLKLNYKNKHNNWNCYTTDNDMCRHKLCLKYNYLKEYNGRLAYDFKNNILDKRINKNRLRDMDCICCESSELYYDGGHCPCCHFNSDISTHESESNYSDVSI
jgi:hypothetical protein